jgi:hypothetical protein
VADSGLVLLRFLFSLSMVCILAIIVMCNVVGRRVEI